MAFGITDFLTLIGALGFFIYGMKVMSEGIQKIAGERLRSILSAMTSNRFLGLFTGFIVTSIIQSSSATTVMTVSFVNAGLLSLSESIGVIMGANIGTTITGWLVSIFGFKVKIASIALPIIAFGFPLLFSNKSSLKSTGEFIVGFALLFMGLEHLKNSVPNLEANPEVFEFLKNYSNMGFLSTLLFVGIGTILTVIIQSSSATMSLTLVMCYQGWLPFDSAAGMILGENIGTTITANLAAIIGNVNAKRSARAHFVFNVFGVIWMLVAFPLVIKLIDSYLVNTSEGSPFVNPHAVPTALAIFHTVFNICNSFLLIWFVPIIEKTVIWMVPAGSNKEKKPHLEYIGTGMMGTPELSLLEAKKEVIRFGVHTAKMLEAVDSLLFEKDGKKMKKTFQKIEKFEDTADSLEADIADYLLKVSEGELSGTGSIRVRSMLSIVGDLESICDILSQMSRNFERKNNEKAWFTPEQRKNLKDMFDIVNQATQVMVQNLEKDYDSVDIKFAMDIEERINKLRNNLRKEHLKSMEHGDYNFNSGMIYTDLFQSLEKIGDNIIGVQEAIKGKV